MRAVVESDDCQRQEFRADLPLYPGRRGVLRMAVDCEHRSNTNMFLGVDKTDETERPCRMNLTEGKVERNCKCLTPFSTIRS